MPTGRIMSTEIKISTSLTLIIAKIWQPSLLKKCLEAKVKDFELKGAIKLITGSV